MESMLLTPWLQRSMYVNMTFFHDLSISVISSNSYDEYICVKNGMFR